MPLMDRQSGELNCFPPSKRCPCPKKQQESFLVLLSLWGCPPFVPECWMLMKCAGVLESLLKALIG